jgi:phosphoribosyl 1,2-cyclic phosphate phosphodiesterase
MRVTILGSGGSGGVPLPGGPTGEIWGGANPENPKNRRRRVSVLVETRGKRLLIDTSPDLRMQIIDNRISAIDAVLYTHAHADHAHGLDDLRSLSYRQEQPIPAYMDADTHASLTMRFDYAFASSHPQSKLYPALMEDHVAEGAFEAAGVPVVSFRMNHGNTHSMGYRIGPFAYTTDVVELDEAAFEILDGVEAWVVDALRDEPHPTHAHTDRTLDWIERVKPKRALLTHLNHTVDYDALKAKCPPGVAPAYDGLVLEIEGD